MGLVIFFFFLSNDRNNEETIVWIVDMIENIATNYLFNVSQHWKIMVVKLSSLSFKVALLINIT